MNRHTLLSLLGASVLLMHSCSRKTSPLILEDQDLIEIGFAIQLQEIYLITRSVFTDNNGSKSESVHEFELHSNDLSQIHLVTTDTFFYSEPIYVGGYRINTSLIQKTFNSGDGPSAFCHEDGKRLILDESMEDDHQPSYFNRLGMAAWNDQLKYPNGFYNRTDTIISYGDGPLCSEVEVHSVIDLIEDGIVYLTFNEYTYKQGKPNDLVQISTGQLEYDQLNKIYRYAKKYYSSTNSMSSIDEVRISKL